MAAFIGNGTAKRYDSTLLQNIELHDFNGRIDIAAKPMPRVIVFYIASHTGQQVKRPAVGAEGFVIDHFSRTAVTNYLRHVGDRWMQAFGDTPPYAVFGDSLEVFGADWTSDFLEEFHHRRGYDLIPYLPRMTHGTDETSAELRHDWGLTLTELINERFLTPINEWAKSHHTRFRSQNYGYPAPSLSSNRLIALPEGEGPQWQQFSPARWASSATHLYGGSVTSAEAWTWLHSPAFRATPLDMKVEADRFFLEGINQFIGHGWPYSPQGIAEPGWRLYAAAVFSDHNPWWTVMPDVTHYLQRVSYLLRQGKPANDIAVFLPDDDAYAESSLGNITLSGTLPKYITPELTKQILSSGYNLDYIDAEAIQNIGIPYPVLVLPHVKRLAPTTLQSLISYVEHGGKIIAVGSTPDSSPGFAQAGEIAKQVQTLSHALLSMKEGTQFVANDTDLGGALRQALAPDIKFEGNISDLGFIHRRLNDADIYFFANTSNRDISATAAFRTSRKQASWWNPFTGASQRADEASVALQFAPYESRILVRSDIPTSASQSSRSNSARVIADMTSDWDIDFPVSSDGRSQRQHFEQLRSWTDSPQTNFYSGEAVYTKTVSLKRLDLANAQTIVIDFGKATPTAADPAIQNGIYALLEAPIREAAVVFINGKRAGPIWHPPYVLDITQYLHVGENQIEVRVANTAINHLAGQAPADYHLLNMRYGQRFIPQDMENLEPLPSGMLGRIQILAMK